MLSNWLRLRSSLHIIIDNYNYGPFLRGIDRSLSELQRKQGVKEEKTTPIILRRTGRASLQYQQISVKTNHRISGVSILSDAPLC